MNNGPDYFSRGNRLPVLLQAEAAECGVACLAMVATSFGYRTTLAELRRRFSASLKGTNLKALMEMADSLGLSGRPLRLEVSDLSKLKTPAILHWNLKHYVVLKKVTRQKICIHDPARGLRVLSMSEVSLSFTGVALEFTSTPAFKFKQDVDRVRLSDLFSHIYGLTPSLLQIFLLATVMQGFALLSPILNQLIVDDAINKGDLDLLSTIGVGMTLLLAITTGVNFLRGFIGLYMGTQLSFQMQSNLLRHTLRLPASWFEKRHIGDILSRFGSLTPVQNVFTGTLQSIILDSVMLVFALTMMIVYAPLLTVIEAGSFLFFFGVRMGTFPYLRRKTNEGLHLGARVQSTFLETLRGARTFKLFGRERERVALWQNELAQAVNNNVQMARFGLWGGVGTGLLSGLQQIAVWYLGARMVIQGHISLGMLLAFQAYTSQFGAAAGGIVGQFFTFRTLRVHLERLSDIVHADPERGIDQPIEAGRQLRGEVAVRELSFRYAEHEPWVLRGVSFEVGPGEFACLTGPSGQGKTTLLKLLLGFIDPAEGEIMYDGVELRSFGIRTFRERIGVVMQDDQLFSGTVADNICFFETEADMERVYEAAKMAQIHDEISRLPMGYLTLVGDLGSTLSGGQKQRVLIARALYRRPSILFLDEGTSNLDPDNERRIMEIVRALPITRIVIAHRDAASAGADRIINVQNRSLSVLEVASGRSAPVTA